MLVEVDPRDYRVALQRAEADYADAQAGLLAAQAGVPITSTTTQSQVSSAGANVERAQAGARGGEPRRGRGARAAGVRAGAASRSEGERRRGPRATSSG